MSSTPARTGSRARQAGEQHQTDPSALLSALVDEDCREILRVTSEQALSAGELSEACGIPSSTVYRKVEGLTEAGLLAEAVRIRPGGSHTSEYECAVSNVEIQFGEEGLDLSVDSRQDRSQSATAD